MASPSKLEESCPLDEIDLTQMMSRLMGEDDNEPEDVEDWQSAPETQPASHKSSEDNFDPVCGKSAASPLCEHQETDYDTKNDETFAKTTSEPCSSASNNSPTDNKTSSNITTETSHSDGVSLNKFSLPSSDSAAVTSAATYTPGLRTSVNPLSEDIDQCLSVGLSEFFAPTNSNFCDISNSSTRSLTNVTMIPPKLASDVTNDPTRRLKNGSSVDHPEGKQQVMLFQRQQQPQQTSPSSLSSSSQELNSCFGTGSSVDSTGWISPMLSTSNGSSSAGGLLMSHRGSSSVGTGANNSLWGGTAASGASVGPVVSPSGGKAGNHLLRSTSSIENNGVVGGMGIVVDREAEVTSPLATTNSVDSGISGSASSFGILGDFMSNISPHSSSPDLVPPSGGLPLLSRASADNPLFYNAPCRSNGEPRSHSPPLLGSRGSTRSQLLDDQSQLAFFDSETPALEIGSGEQRSLAIDNLLKLSMLNVNSGLQEPPIRQQQHQGWDDQGGNNMDFRRGGGGGGNSSGAIGSRNHLPTEAISAKMYFEMNSSAGIHQQQQQPHSPNPSSLHRRDLTSSEPNHNFDDFNPVQQQQQYTSAAFPAQNRNQQPQIRNNASTTNLAANLSALVSLRTAQQQQQQPMISPSLQQPYHHQHHQSSRSPQPNAQQQLQHFQDFPSSVDIIPSRSVQHPYNSPPTPRSGMDFGMADSHHQRGGGGGGSLGGPPFMPSMPVPASDASLPMHIRSKFGQMGPGLGMFNMPHGFCLGLNEEIIVADTYNNRIQVFDKSGVPISFFGVQGKEEGRLWFPRKIAVLRHNGNYVVCDRGGERSRMQIFTQSGVFIRKIAIRYIDIVAGLAINRHNQIVAVDSVTPTVFIISEQGVLVNYFECSNFMAEPSDIGIHKDEYYICDFKGHSVVVIGEDGQFRRRIGNERITCFPNGIDISDAGDVLIGDSHGNQFHIAVFDDKGNYVSQFQCPSVKVSRCCGLKITSEGYVITLAKNNHHVLVLNTLYVN